VRQTGCQSRADPLDPYPNDWNRSGGRANRQRNRIGSGNDDLGAAGDDLASDLGIAFWLPSAGIPLDREVLSFDMTQTAQLLEECPKERTVVDQSDGTGKDDRNPVLLCRLLRPYRLHGGSEQQTDREIAAPHSITWSASARRAGGMVRFNRRAVFRLM